MNIDISRRLIGASAVLSAERKVTDVDIHGLVRRLLLFDKYVLVSVRLQEFPFLANHLGFTGLRDLLSAKLIEIRCECLQLSQTGQSGLLGDPVLPLFSYRFHWIDAHDGAKYVHDCLQGMHTVPGIERKQILRLKRAIAGAIRRIPEDIRTQLYPAFEHELIHNPALVKTAVAMVLNSRHGLSDIPFSITLHQEATDTFRVETDIHNRARISEVETHKAVEAGLLGVAGLSQSIGEMKCYSAISGFRDEDLPLFRKKFDFLVGAVSAQAKEENFRRVIDIAGLPDFPTDNERIDVQRLLEVRESNEARQFRDWLGGIGQVEDEEIRQRVAGLRAKVGVKVGGEAGKAMRFLVTSGLSFIPGASAAALAMGAFDQFALDKLLPRSGITAFVDELYPSIFEKDRR